MSDEDQTPQTPEEAAIIKSLETVMTNASNNLDIENLFHIVATVGGWLCAWRESMIEGKFTEDWVEEAAMILFRRFFETPTMTGQFITGNDDGD